MAMLFGVLFLVYKDLIISTIVDPKIEPRIEEPSIRT